MTWLLVYVMGLFLSAFRRSLCVAPPRPSPDQRELAQLFLWPLFATVAFGTWMAERLIDAIYGSYRLTLFEKRLARGFELTEDEVALKRGRRGAWFPRARCLLPWLWKTAKRTVSGLANMFRNLRRGIRRKVIARLPKRTAWDMLEPGLQVVVERFHPEWAEQLRQTPAPKSYAVMLKSAARAAGARQRGAAGA